MLWWYRSTIPRDEWSVDGCGSCQGYDSLERESRWEYFIDLDPRRSFRRVSNAALRLGRDANSVSLRSIVPLLLFASRIFPFEIESRISLAKRDASVQEIKLSIPRSEGRRGKLEGAKLRSFMSFFVKKCEGVRCMYSASFHGGFYAIVYIQLEWRRLIYDS